MALHVWHGGRSSGKLPKVSDIVLVKEGPRRSTWPLARVVELLTGADGTTRVAAIFLNGIITRRAVSLLYPLEAEQPWEGSPSSNAQLGDESDSTPSSHGEESDTDESAPPSVCTRGGRQVRRPARFQ